MLILQEWENDMKKVRNPNKYIIFLANTNMSDE